MLSGLTIRHFGMESERSRAWSVNLRSSTGDRAFVIKSRTHLYAIPDHDSHRIDSDMLRSTTAAKDPDLSIDVPQ